MMKARGNAPSPTMTFAVSGMQAGPDFNTEAYGYHKDNDYLRVADQPLSTFSIDVDTASYANVRRFLQQGQRPPGRRGADRELVNYFPYHYAPRRAACRQGSALESAARRGIRPHRLGASASRPRGERRDAPPANLVFLLDVSGSMHQANTLPLVKQSLRLLVNKLRPDDHVAHTRSTADASGPGAGPRPARPQGRDPCAIDRLEASGSTNRRDGHQLAYDIARPTS